MSDSLADRYFKTATRPVEKPGLELIESSPDDTDDCGAFGYLRGVRDRALMLELRKKDGNIQAFGYAWLAKAEFDPSVGIRLHFGTQLVQIRGRNLNAEMRPNVRLFEAILRHRVPWIQEADAPALMALPEGQVVIEQMEW